MPQLPSSFIPDDTQPEAQPVSQPAAPKQSFFTLFNDPERQIKAKPQPAPPAPKPTPSPGLPNPRYAMAQGMKPLRDPTQPILDIGGVVTRGGEKAKAEHPDMSDTRRMLIDMGEAGAEVAGSLTSPANLVLMASGIGEGSTLIRALMNVGFKTSMAWSAADNLWKAHKAWKAYKASGDKSKLDEAVKNWTASGINSLFLGAGGREKEPVKPPPGDSIVSSIAREGQKRLPGAPPSPVEAAPAPPAAPLEAPGVPRLPGVVAQPRTLPSQPATQALPPGTIELPAPAVGGPIPVPASTQPQPKALTAGKKPEEAGTALARIDLIPHEDRWYAIDRGTGQVVASGETAAEAERSVGADLHPAAQPEEKVPADFLKKIERGVVTKGDVTVKTVVNGDGFGVETTVNGDRRYPTEPPMSMEEAQRFAYEQLNNPRPTQIPTFEPKAPEPPVSAPTAPPRIDPYQFADQMVREGVGRQTSWTKWLQKTNLNPGMDAGDWYKIYDSSARLPQPETRQEPIREAQAEPEPVVSAPAVPTVPVEATPEFRTVGRVSGHNQEEALSAAQERWPSKNLEVSKAGFVTEKPEQQETERPAPVARVEPPTSAPEIPTVTAAKPSPAATSHEESLVITRSAREKVDKKTGLTKSQKEFLSGKLAEAAAQFAESPTDAPVLPISISIPGDGTFTLRNEAAASTLHKTVTGKPLPDIEPLQRSAFQPHSESFRYKPSGTPDIEQAAKRASEAYGGATKAIAAIDAQMAMLEQDPETLATLDTSKVAAIRSQLETLRAQEKKAGNIAAVRDALHKDHGTAAKAIENYWAKADALGDSIPNLTPQEKNDALSSLQDEARIDKQVEEAAKKGKPEDKAALTAESEHWRPAVRERHAQALAAMKPEVDAYNEAVSKMSKFGSQLHDYLMAAEPEGAWLFIHDYQRHIGGLNGSNEPTRISLDPKHWKISAERIQEIRDHIDDVARSFGLKVPSTPNPSAVMHAPVEAPKLPAPSGRDPRLMSDAEIEQEKAELATITKPLYEQMDKFGEDIFLPTADKYAVKYKPEYKAIQDQLNPYESRNHTIDFEVRRREQEAANKRSSEAKDKRIAEAPVYQRRNGWEIVKEMAQYAVRHPVTKEEIYIGSLRRSREVADESTPDQVIAEATAQPEAAQPAPDAPVAPPVLRATPAPGTTERTTLDRESDEAEKVYDELMKKRMALEDEKRKTRSYTKKADALEKKIEAAREKESPAFEKYKTLRQQHYLARLEDAAEQTENKILQAGAKFELKSKEWEKANAKATSGGYSTFHKRAV